MIHIIQFHINFNCTKLKFYFIFINIFINFKNISILFSTKNIYKYGFNFDFRENYYSYFHNLSKTMCN